MFVLIHLTDISFVSTIRFSRLICLVSSGIANRISPHFKTVPAAPVSYIHNREVRPVPINIYTDRNIVDDLRRFFLLNSLR